MQQDGLMRFLQANSTPFSDRNLLPNVIADAVQQHEWDPRWKNQLCLERDPAQYVDARLMPENVLDTAARDLGRYFHIRVRNLDPRKAALNCYAYLERVRDISAHRDIRVETIEFKWAGYTLPNAAIGAGSERRLDAFWVPHNAPNVLQFNVFADSTEFIPRIRGPGDFEMTYVVVSENFAPARRTFLLHVGTRLDEIHFRGL